MSQPGLRRVLGQVGLTSLGIGGTVGTGIFVMAGAAARDVAGPAILVSFVVAAVACACAALCYAHLSARFPEAGSAYAYARALLPRPVAFLVGWNLILQYVLAAASIGQGWSHYAQDALAALGGGGLPTALRGAGGSPPGAVVDLPALLATLALTALILRGISPSVRVNHAIVVVKLAIIALIVAIGAAHFRPEHWRPFAPYGWGGLFAGAGPPRGVLAGAAVVFYAFLGFEALTNYTEESNAPARDVPRSMLASLGISTALYLAMAAALTGMVPYGSISPQAPVSEAFGQIGMGWVRSVVAVGALLAITSVLLVILLSLPRVLMAISRDGVLSEGYWGRIAANGVPARATATGGAVIALLAAVVPLNALGVVAVMANLVTFVVIALLALRFRTSLHPAAPVGTLALVSVLLLSLPWFGWPILGLWWALGAGLYAFRSRRVLAVAS